MIWGKRLLRAGVAVALVYFADYLARAAFGKWAGPLAAAAAGACAFLFLEAYWDD